VCVLSEYRGLRLWRRPKASDVVGELIDLAAGNQNAVVGELKSANDAVMVGDDDERKVGGGELVEGLCGDGECGSAGEQGGGGRLDVELQVVMGDAGLFAGERGWPGVGGCGFAGGLRDFFWSGFRGRFGLGEKGEEANALVAKAFPGGKEGCVQGDALVAPVGK